MLRDPRHRIVGPRPRCAPNLTATGYMRTLCVVNHRLVIWYFQSETDLGAFGGRGLPERRVYCIWRSALEHLCTLLVDLGSGEGEELNLHFCR